MRPEDWAASNGRPKLYWFVILVVALGAFVARAPCLRMRPMHTDEAVHADRFGTLLEKGEYEYDPREYHGPTLNYFTLVPAWLSAARTYARISEITLRIVPVAFGVLLIVLLVFVVRGLGAGAVLAAVLVAVSPAMFFYSRYYIQETLLVCFTFGAIVCGYRYVRTKALAWVLAAGVFIGLMHATKETCIIAFGSMGLACLLLMLIQVGRTGSIRAVLAGIRPGHVVAALAAALVVSAVFYSSFFTHPRGILDSYLTYTTYLGRAGGQSTMHVHPWHYYLKMLLFARYGQGPVWTEGWIVLLALVGLAVAVTGRSGGLIDPGFVRFLALYTAAMTVVYSALPYKTPWCLLGFLHGMILLAGVGGVVLLTCVRGGARQIAMAVLLVAMMAHLAFQAYRANFVYYADSHNPYVYAHPTEEIFTAVQKVQEYAGLDGLGRTPAKPIQVACPGDDYWPLPWYLRSLCVAFQKDLPEDLGPLILIGEDLQNALTHRLYVATAPEQRQMYLYLFDAPYYVWARPGIKLFGFVRRDLWERRQQRPDPNELIRKTDDR